jgi:transketolase
MTANVDDRAALTHNLDSDAAKAPAVEVKPYGVAFTQYAEQHENVLCVTNDLTASCEADEFRARLPERYFSLGMAEQNLAGVLGGMAREGFVPFYPTFSVFGTRRPYEQIALAIAYPALPVRLIGFLPGLTTPGGVTHQASDDIALMSQLPNMTVLEVGDACEARTVLDVMDSVDGPVFCRMLRGEVPVLFDTPMEFNRARTLAAGDEVLLISSGVHTQITSRVVAQLHQAAVQAGHVHVSTLKPFTDPLIVERLASARAVVTVENHLVRGGLGTAVAEVIAENGLGVRLNRVGVKDTFTHGGTRDYLFEYYHLDDVAILDAVDSLLGRSVVPRAANGAAMHTQQHNAAVAEGL